VSQVLIILAAILGAIFPNFQKQLSKAAINYVGAIDYVSVGERQNVIAGQLVDLLDHIATKGIYRHIQIVAYSFGSIIAIDNLFPFGQKPAERYNLVHTLVTIGSPFDLIRLFWPDYFRERQALPDIPKRWFNIYSLTDVLSSNFRDDAHQDKAQQTVSVTNSGTAPLVPTNISYNRGMSSKSLSAFDLITLTGLRAHAMYWEREHEAETTCFSVMVAEMYAGDQMLR
jgi:hypothetical protein